MVDYVDSSRLVIRARSRDHARQRATKVKADPAFAAMLRVSAKDVPTIIAKLQAEGVTSLRAIANQLNQRNVPTPRGFGKWYASQVARAISRAHLLRAAASGSFADI